MDLSVGSAFPAPRVAERLNNQIGHLENVARTAARCAGEWLARTGVLPRRTPRRVSKRAPSPSRLGDELKQLQGEMLARTGVRIALGAGRSTVVAGTASRLAGWDAPRVVLAGHERAFLAPLPLQKLYGLPSSTLRVLRASGMVTIGELQRVPKAALQAEFGQAEGLRLWRSARGLDPIACDAQTAPRAVARMTGTETLVLSGALREMPSYKIFAKFRGQLNAALRRVAF